MRVRTKIFAGRRASSLSTAVARQLRQILLLALLPAAVSAQTQNPGLGLIGLDYNNEVEEAAAAANQATFDALDPLCNPGGVLDALPMPPAPPPGSSCTDDHFFVYVNTRELVHTANELRGSGANAASLGTDLDGLGRALRWTAAEELAAIGSMATEFANGQLSNLAARLNSFRLATAASPLVALSNYTPSRDTLLASNQGAAGDIAAGQSTPGETYGRWGAFINGGFGFGRREPTPLEDAFDFDGSELTFGVDRRIGTGLIAGAIVGVGEQTVDFDEAASGISVVDGSIESDAASLLLFSLYQADHLNLSGSIGKQSIDYQMSRSIKYASINPNTDSTNSIANSQPNADVTTATFGAGYAFSPTLRFTFEPVFYAEYVAIDVDAFEEERSINLLSDSSISKRFDLGISEQSIESLDLSVTLRFQYVFTPSFGVAIPYLNLETHRELRDNSRTITTGFSAVADVLGTQTFRVPTDVPDQTYFVTRLGFSTILRGGRQREAGGRISGGLSAFLQLMTVRRLHFYDDDVVTGGFRYEF